MEVIKAFFVHESNDLFHGTRSISTSRLKNVEKN